VGFPFEPNEKPTALQNFGFPNTLILLQFCNGSARQSFRCFKKYLSAIFAAGKHVTIM
jgi:hypothetical protein